MKSATIVSLQHSIIKTGKTNSQNMYSNIQKSTTAVHNSNATHTDDTAQLSTKLRPLYCNIKFHYKDVFQKVSLEIKNYITLHLSCI